MSFRFRRGTRESTSCLIGLAGASGSGKTFSAIVLALGLAYPDMKPAEIMSTIEREGRSRVAMLDTEGGRGLHYAPKPGEQPDFKNTFPFEYAELSPPFTPNSYKEAFVFANEQKFAVLIIDSMSHEYEGEGGLLEWADKLEQGEPKPGISEPRTYGQGWQQDWLTPPVKSPGNWTKPKSSHKQMVNRALQCRMHMIFCLRAEEKMKLVQEEKTGQGGQTYRTTKVIPAADRPIQERWEPICEKRFMYEMTCSFILLPSDPGVPVVLKLEEQHRECFPEGRQISGASGRCLAKWARGDLRSAGPRHPPMEESPPAETDRREPEPEAKRERAPEPETKAEATPQADAETAEITAWVDGYIAKVAQIRSLDALTQLQDEARAQRQRIRIRFPEMWSRIVDAESAVEDDRQSNDELFGHG